MKLRLLVLASAIFLVNCGGDDGGDVNSLADRNVRKVNEYDATGFFSSEQDPIVSDSDTNDAHSTPVSNSTRDHAQAVPTNATINGYLASPGRGPVGPLYDTGDLSDVYFIRLESGQNYFVEFNPLDSGGVTGANISLYSVASNTLVDSSDQIVTAPADGDYFLSVSLGAGSATYRLAPITSADDMVSSRTRADSTADLIPDEIIVKFKSNPNARTRFAGTQKLSLSNSTDVATLQALSVNTHASAARSSSGTSAEAARALSVVEQLRQRPDVEYATVNRLRFAHATEPNDPLYPKQWHYATLNLPKAWDISKGDGVIVAVIDSGIVTPHPDLKDNLLPGCDFVKVPPRCGEAFDEGGDNLLPNGKSTFHGTHVAGTIAAVSNNGQGTSGVAWNTQILPLRALDSSRGGAGTMYDIMQACLYAAGLPNATGKLPARRADIINMSLGGPVLDPYEQDILDQLEDAGVIVVASAGNSGVYKASYPAAYSTVFSVGAVDRSKAHASYSTMHDSLDLVAPGGDLGEDLDNDLIPDGVLSTHSAELGNHLVYSYNYLQGTSMAAPHVAGVFALMKSIYPQLTPSQLRTLLSDGSLTEDQGIPGHDASYGWGVIDAYKAVLQAARLAGVPASTAPPELVVSASQIDFNLYRQVATLTVSNGGLGDLTITGTSSDSAWLSISPGSVNPDGLGQYELRVDRSALTIGTHTGFVQINSTAGNQLVTVSLTKTEAAPPASYGFQHLEIYRMSDRALAHSQFVDSLSGNSFGFKLPEDDYVLLSWQDLDGNGLGCEANELCSQMQGFGLRDVLSGLDLKLELNAAE